MCTKICATKLGRFGEIGANFSLQLSSPTRFDKINKKKVIAENQCEKHKNRVKYPLFLLHKLDVFQSLTVVLFIYTEGL